jgi:hypothetical protein
MINISAVCGILFIGLAVHLLLVINEFESLKKVVITFICILVVLTIPSLVANSNENEVYIKAYDLVAINDTYLLEDENNEAQHLYYIDKNGDINKFTLTDKEYSVVDGAEKAEMLDRITRHIKGIFYVDTHDYRVYLPKKGL